MVLNQVDALHAPGLAGLRLRRPRPAGRLADSRVEEIARGKGGYRSPACVVRRVFHRDRRRDPAAHDSRSHRRKAQPDRVVRATAARQDVVGGQYRRRRGIRIPGCRAGFRVGAAGSGAAGDLAAVRPAVERLLRASAGQPVPVVVGGAARGVGGGDRHRRQSHRGHSRAGLELWIWVAAIMGPAMALGVLGSRIWSGRPVAAVLLALVSGSLWGCSRS